MAMIQNTASKMFCGAKNTAMLYPHHTAQHEEKIVIVVIQNCGRYRNSLVCSQNASMLTTSCVVAGETRWGKKKKITTEGVKSKTGLLFI
jgi:hypothetical protein